MSIKQILTTVLAMTALVTHVAFAAGTPPNVTSIQANLEGTTLKASWSPVDGAAFYRVYFSHASILDNNGNYDDFERTSGADAMYTFTKLPLSSENIFISVLAVNAEGIESEGFEVEATVTVPKTAPTPSSVPAIKTDSIMPTGENPTSTSEPMVMISAEAVSATGVLVTFSKNIDINVALTSEYFVIANSGGTVSPITRITTNAATILISMEKQIPEQLYIVYILQPIPAGDGTHAPRSGATVTFLGYGKATQVQNQPSPVTPPPEPYVKAPVASLEDPTSLDIRATPRKDGTYDITARWNPANGVDGYGVYTSINGANYALSGVVPAGQTSVMYRNVKGEDFSLKLTSKNNQGTESRGIERSIKLPSTGLGLLGIMGAAGAAAGMRVRRRRKAV